MTNETMTIFEGLNELKMLEKRIKAGISKPFVLTHKKFTNKINNKSISEAEIEIMANFTSVIELIKRRSAIKNAIVLSNAGVENVEGTIDILKYIKPRSKFNFFCEGKKFTMAEIIDIKNNLLPILVDFRNKLAMEKMETDAALSYNQGRILDDAKLNSSKTFGGRENIDPDAVKRYEENFIESNTVVAVDPINIDKAVQELSEIIDVLDMKIDTLISVHNATAVIDISY